MPLGIPFLCLKEDAELASEFLGHDSKGIPYLWGVDQEFIGSPVFHLQRLVATAPNDSARAAADKLLTEEKEAAAKGAQDKFLLAHFHGTGLLGSRHAIQRTVRSRNRSSLNCRKVPPFINCG